MPNPPEPDNTEPGEQPGGDEQATETQPVTAAEDETAVLATDPETDLTAADTEAVTEVITTEAPAPEPGADGTPERRFTAPGFDAGRTEIMPSVGDAETEFIAQQSDDAGKAIPQQIPARSDRLPSAISRSWGWVMALILIILALAAIAVLGTLWLTRDTRAAASQEEHVRTTISNFDIAMQNGDLAALRSLTCGDIRDRYVNYDQKAWDETYRRITAAKQYPVVASIDEVVVNDGHAEANVTAFMAYEPRVRSTRSFDLQFRDDQWKICQSHGN
ncbi:Rv0361 family membrane protein [Mycolicibacter minnesotensis]